MSHGQSSVERGFNINDNHARTNITAEGLTARRMVVDYLHAEDITAETFNITKELLGYARRASSQRILQLKDNKKGKKMDESKIELRKICEEICHLKDRQKVVLQQIDDLRKESQELFQKAEKMNRMSCVTAGLAIGNEIPGKEAELKKLSEGIKQLEEQASRLNHQSAII